MSLRNSIEKLKHIVKVLFTSPLSLFAFGFTLFVSLFQAFELVNIIEIPLYIIGWIILCLLSTIIIIWGKNGRENDPIDIQKSHIPVSQIYGFWRKGGLSFLALLLSAFVSFARVGIDEQREMLEQENWGSFTNQDSEIKVLIDREPVPRHQEVAITGTILSDVGSKIAFTLPRYPKVSVGDICFLRGNISVPENFSDFNYKEYLSNKRVYRIIQVKSSSCSPYSDLPFLLNIKVYIMRLKAELIVNIDRNLPEPQSSLLAGIVFGQERVFSDDFDLAVRNAGVSHVVAASGYNISFVVGIASSLFAFVSEKKRVVTNLLFVWLYCVMTGLPSSIVRAGLMYTIAQASKFFGLRLSIFDLMLFTLAGFLLIDPRIFSDVGFQLSYLATLGLVYLLPLAQSFVDRVGLSWMSESVLLPTLCCTITTLPVTVLTFRKLPILSILVNTLVLPVIDSALMLGIGAVSVSYLFPSLSRLLYAAIWAQLKYFEGVVSFFGSVAWATISF